jgi:hypothetical protein
MNLLCDTISTVSKTDMGDNNKEKDLQYMLSCLSEEELELAARTSYQALRHNMKDGSSGSEQEKWKHAKAMARRYLESKKEVEKALQCMKDTLQFRKERKLDRLVTIFDSPASNDDDSDDSDEQFRAKLKAMLSCKKNFVMGYDKQGRATFHFVPRQTLHHDPEWTLLESIYTMERAIACSQQQLDKNTSPSNPHEATTTPSSNVTINAVIDCAGFNVWTQGPPLDVGTAFLQTLRQHYVGNFYRIFILDAPLGFAWLWKIFSPLVGTSTRDKIVFLTGQAEKETILREYYNLCQAGPWMLEGGQKDRELDIDEYLFKTPFDRAFDECGVNGSGQSNLAI